MDGGASLAMAPHTHLFNQVDRTEDPDFFVRFMDEAQKPSGIRESKRLMLERIALGAGRGGPRRWLRSRD
jgi:hypothetical protein